MSLLVQIAKKAAGKLLPPALTMTLSAASGFDRGMKYLGGTLAAGTAISSTEKTKAILDNLVTIDGDKKYPDDYAYFLRRDWARSLLALDNVDAGTLYLIETSSDALPGYEIIVFSKFDAALRGCKLKAKLQKRGGVVPESQMTAFIEAIAQMAEQSEALYRQATNANQRTRAE